MASLKISVMRISIPSGTIKSRDEEVKEVVETEFQFLLVRLKVADRGRKAFIEPNFNSFWYD